MQYRFCFFADRLSRLYGCLFLGLKLIYRGKETQIELNDLKPNSNLHYKLKISALGNDSPYSDVTSVLTGA